MKDLKLMVNGNSPPFLCSPCSAQMLTGCQVTLGSCLALLIWLGGGRHTPCQWWACEVLWHCTTCPSPKPLPFSQVLRAAHRLVAWEHLPAYACKQPWTWGPVDRASLETGYSDLEMHPALGERGSCSKAIEILPLQMFTSEREKDRVWSC